MPIKHILIAVSVLRRLMLAFTQSVSKSLHSIWLPSLCHSRTEISRDFSFCIYFQGIRSTLCLTHSFSLGRLMESEVVKQEIQFAIKELGHRALIECHAFQTVLTQSPGHGAYVSLIQQSGFWAWEKDRLLKTNNLLLATHFWYLSFSQQSLKRVIGGVPLSL